MVEAKTQEETNNKTHPQKTGIDNVTDKKA